MALVVLYGLQSGYGNEDKRTKNTITEKLLRASLRQARLNQYKICPKNVIGRPDIHYPRYRVAIFVNGYFWYNCKVCKLSLPKSNRFFWRHKFLVNRGYDSKNTIELRRPKWKVFTFWEHQIRRNPDKSASIVKAYVRDLPPSSL